MFPPASIASSVTLEASLCVETLSSSRARTGALQRRLKVRDVHREPIDDAVECVVLNTDRGALTGCWHAPAPDGRWRHANFGVVLVGGAGGGLDGPADGAYPELARRWQTAGLAALRLDYRYPNTLPECVLDALLGVAFARSEGVVRVGLVGHSFGGAVAICAGAFSPDVHAVATLATQTYGADLVSELTPRPLLVLHGTADEVLPSVCSELVYAAAREPRELQLIPGARHDLRSARDPLLTILESWLPAALQRAHAPRASRRPLELREI